MPERAEKVEATVTVVHVFRIVDWWGLNDQSICNIRYHFLTLSCGSVVKVPLQLASNEDTRGTNE